MKTSRMGSRVGVILIAAIVALSALGCSGAATSTPSPKSTVKQENVEMVNPKLVAANTRFGFKLFSEILKKDTQKNVFVSPSSVAIALSMTYNGASGETQQAMANALQLQGLSLSELNQANANLKTNLEKGDPSVTVAIANSLWARNGVSFNSEFIKRNQTFYDAEIKTLDFNSAAAPREINGWVNEKTNGKISEIIDQIRPDQVMFLINAIYFNGKWTNEFDKNQTEARSFYLANGKEKQHPLMQQKGKYRYYENDQFQAVSLPYGNEQMSLYLFLPSQKSSLSDFHKTLNSENWQTWMGQFSQRQGSVQIPRFKLSYDIELKEALSALGMAVAFDKSKADFSRLSDVETNINQVKHKTFVEVNEEGTEAAAVTSVGITVTSVQIEEPPFDMVVNRPFFCAIRDNKTGEILFMGSIINPNL
ncbi:serpin family protein [Myxacorys almedinensis]|uniref:Serpin family protein n=1 Tax=Myxacorys almedinensis A TaxID=2690445 RepID=A0A8J8CIN3_9CYAN|nr:serpin family protein [Myxacorys almedinensis]NDJ16731.1 serpin family protein [Myxacorys almedinensis A]